MITKLNNTISNLKSLFIETFLNKTSKVSDVSDGSITNATAHGAAKLAQKTIKDVAIVEAQIFPDTASGEYLDRAAQLFGVSPRKGALQSSTYVRVRAEGAATYSAVDGSYFVNMNGIRFNILGDGVVLSIPAGGGYGYIPVVSDMTGSITNVAANTILTMSNPPLNHVECTNEYQAIGGRDEEDDEMFRRRIKNNNNVLSATTAQKLLQTMQEFNPNILKILNTGLNEEDSIHILVATQNGALLTPDELKTLTNQISPYLSLADLDLYGNSIGVDLANFGWYFVGSGANIDDGTGVDFRVSLDSTLDSEDIRQRIQISMTKYLDFRNWEPGDKIKWDDLLRIVKNTSGVIECPNTSFYPNTDETPNPYQLPRIGKFIMRDLGGKIMYTDQLTPVFYSN